MRLAERKGFIAEDLGYILRDEERYEEAIQAFSITASEGPTSYLTFVELAGLYDRVGDTEKADFFRSKCPKAILGKGSKRPWWKFWKRGG